MNRMTLWVLVALAVASVLLAYDWTLLHPKPAPLPPAGPSAEDRFEALRKYADETSGTAFDFAEACEARGDLTSAEEYFMKAIKIRRGYPKATERLRVRFAPEWLRAAGDDLEKLDAVVARFQKSGMDEEARALATRVMERTPTCPNSSKLLDVGTPDSPAARLVFEKYLEASGIKATSLSARELLVMRQRWQACLDFRVSEKDICWLDTAPASPFLLMMEKSNGYNADLMLEAFKEACVVFCRTFSAEFGKQFDGTALARTEVCPVYIFENRDRYAQICGVPSWCGGDFNARSGRITFYKDTSQFFETLFHLLTHAVVHQAWLRRDDVIGKLTDTEMAWFSEGLSGYMETFTHDAKGEIVLLEPSAHYQPFVKKLIADGKAVRLPEFMSLTWAAYAKRRDDMAYNSRTSAQAWALVYFLNKYENGKYHEEFREYLAFESAGKGGLEAAKTCFGDLEALDREFTAYFKNLR